MSFFTLFRELDLKFEADKQKALSGILAEVTIIYTSTLIFSNHVFNLSNITRSALVFSPPSHP